MNLPDLIGLEKHCCKIAAYMLGQGLHEYWLSSNCLHMYNVRPTWQVLVGEVDFYVDPKSIEPFVKALKRVGLKIDRYPRARPSDSMPCIVVTQVVKNMDAKKIEARVADHHAPTVQPKADGKIVGTWYTSVVLPNSKRHTRALTSAEVPGIYKSVDMGIDLVATDLGKTKTPTPEDPDLKRERAIANLKLHKEGKMDWLALVKSRE